MVSPDFGFSIDKLNDALKDKAITVNQYTRALKEIDSLSFSNVLKAFLDGKIDASNFGKVY
jgi:predicted RNA-binding protein associated with RNAse of E/G family